MAALVMVSTSQTVILCIHVIPITHNGTVSGFDPQLLIAECRDVPEQDP